MRSSARMIAITASAVFFISALNLCAAEVAKASAVDEMAMDTSIASGTDSSAMPYSAVAGIGAPRVELFLGYSYLRAMPTLAAGNRLVWMNGGSTSVAFNLNRYLGLVADFGAYTNSEIRFTGAYTGTVDVDNANVAALSYLFGPRLSFRNHERITPFVQVLAGGAHANEVLLANCTANCMLLPSQRSFAMTAGGGLDLKVRHHLAIRIIQAEYLMTRFQDFNTGATATQNDMRLSTGIVFRFGGHASPPLPPPAPVTYFCSVIPTSVYPGEPISASGTALSLDPTKTAVYTWSVDGGTVTAASSTAKIDTTNVAPGNYTLKCHVSEGDKPTENADATAPYIVKAYEPPTVSCSANPRDVISGASSTITATGISPQNRPLNYTYSSSSGTVSGTGTTASLSTVGAPVGDVTVTCNVVDDKGQSASGTTSVTVAVPTAAPKPVTSEMCSIHFDRDASRPTRVDNEGKACLDDIALKLLHNSDAQLAIVGNSASGERSGKKLATERAANTKAYLVREKGVDSSRIAVYTGSQNGKIVTTVLIPSGATFDPTGDTPVN